jgi:hypothetical protein
MPRRCTTFIIGRHASSASTQRLAAMTFRMQWCPVRPCNSVRLVFSAGGRPAALCSHICISDPAVAWIAVLEDGDRFLGLDIALRRRLPFLYVTNANWALSLVMRCNTCVLYVKDSKLAYYLGRRSPRARRALCSPASGLTRLSSVPCCVRSVCSPTRQACMPPRQERRTPPVTATPSVAWMSTSAVMRSGTRR